MSLIPEDLKKVITPDQTTLLDKFLADAQYLDKSILQSLTLHEKEAFLKLLKAFRRTGGMDLEFVHEIDFTEKPVSPYEFLTHEYYYGNNYENLYPIWRKELLAVLDPKNKIKEHILSGAIGVGKSTVATVEVAYKLAYLTWVRDIYDYYPSIRRGSKIAIGLFNTTLDKTGQSIYHDFLTTLNAIPYFKDKFRVVKKKKGGYEEEEIALPKNIRVVPGSNSSHALSLNLFAAVLDEQNFREGRKKLQYQDSKAFDLYRTVSTRIDSRFRYAPTLIVTISSANTVSDFMTEHIAVRQHDPQVHISRPSQWEAKPWEFPSGKFFRVALGDGQSSSKILTEDDEVVEGRKVIEIPEELRGKFIENLEGNIRDLAGIDTAGSASLIHDKSKLKIAADKGKVYDLYHPFTCYETTLDIRTKHRLEDIFVPSILLSEKGRGYTMKRHPYAQRYIHVDLAENGDSAAIAMAHIAEGQSMKVVDIITGKPTESYVPTVEIDFIMKINPPLGSKIDFDKIVNFVMYLKKELHVVIGRVTYDGWQSHHSVQILEKNGYNTKVLSLDKTDKYYIMLQQIISTERLVMYDYPPFSQEVVHLVHDAAIHKVDHLRGLTKDASDAVCGAIVGCLEEGKTSRLPFGATVGGADIAPDNTHKGNWAMKEYKIPDDTSILNILTNKFPRRGSF